MCYPMFEGDIQGNYIKPFTDTMDIQFAMYDYISSTIASVVEARLKYADSKTLFLTNEEMYFIEHNVQNDHRLFQHTHDVLAAVFRWKQMFEIKEHVYFKLPNLGIDDFFKQQYIDTDFLNDIDFEHYGVCKEWYDFVNQELEDNDEIICLLRRIRFPKDQYEVEKRWENCHLVVKSIKKKYSNISWTYV